MTAARDAQRLNGAGRRGRTVFVRLREEARTPLAGADLLLVAAWLAVITLGAALLVLGLEQTVAGSTIRTFGDALAWSFATLVAGDAPRTATREAILVGALLRLAGLAAVLYVGARLVALFLARRVEALHARDEGDTARRLSDLERHHREEREEFRAMREEMRALTDELAARRAASRRRFL